jgi:MFS transporter, FHS family, L-fucose permease
MLYVTLFFESICFPTIVALGMRGLGKYTKRGSGIIVGGVCGGAVVPPILGATADAYSTATAMLVPLCFFVAAWTYSLAVNFVPEYRIPADKFSTAKIGLQDAGVSDEEKASSGDEMEEKGMTQNHENVQSEEVKGL